VSQNKNWPGWGGFWRYIKFFQKVLDLFFLLWHKRKVNGRNAPGPKPAKRLVPRGFLRLGPDQRGDQDAAARIEAGRRGNPQDAHRRMAKPLRRHSALVLTRFKHGLFVMTGEVRLVGERTPNLPEAAAMAAMDWGPSVVDRLGASAPEVRLPVKMAVARGVSGCRRGRLSPWPDGDRCDRESDDGPPATVAGGPRFVRRRWLWPCCRTGDGAGSEPEDRLRVSLTRARGLSGVDGRGRAGRDRDGQRGRGPFAGGAGGGRRFVRAGH